MTGALGNKKPQILSGAFEDSGKGLTTLAGTVFYTAVSGVGLTDIAPAHFPTTFMTGAIMFITVVTNIVTVK